MIIVVRKYNLTLNEKIYKIVEKILKERHPYYSDYQFGPEITFQVELVIDSIDMYELMDVFEARFDIIISQDDIDDYMFQPLETGRIGDIKRLTVQNAVDYIEKQIRASNYRYGVRNRYSMTNQYPDPSKE